MSSANASAPYIIAPPARSSARKSARPRLPAVDEDIISTSIILKVLLISILSCFFKAFN